jgi:hypothetical protein
VPAVIPVVGIVTDCGEAVKLAFEIAENPLRERAPLVIEY